MRGVDREAMVAQEKKDFTLGLEAFSRILKGREWNLSPTEIREHYDATLSVSGREFVVELKDRSQSLDYGTYPILKEKYDYLMELDDGSVDGILYMVFNDVDNSFNLYNLSKINLSDCIVRPWRIRKYQMSEDDHIEEQMTIFLPFKLIACRGYFSE